MELIRNDVVLKFSEEEVRALNKVVAMLKSVEDAYERLDDEEYDTDDLGDFYSAFGEIYSHDLEAFGEYIKENGYAITVKRWK